MADFASLHEEADALGDNFMSQMMSSGTLDGTGADTALSSSGGMPGYSSSFLPNGHTNGDNDDSSSVSSQLSSASSSTTPSQKQDCSSSSSLEDMNQVGEAAGNSSEESSLDEDDARPYDQLHPGGVDDASGNDSMTSASQSSEELLASALAEVVKSEKKTKSHVSKKNAAAIENGKPKPKLRLSLKLSSAKAATTTKAIAAKKKNVPPPVTKVSKGKEEKTEDGEAKVRKKPGPKPGTKKRKAEEIGDAEAKVAKVKKKPGPKPKALKAGGTGVAGGVPPKKRKISTPKSKTTKDADAKGSKGKGVKGKNPNKNKGKKGSGAGNASNDAGPGTALEIMLPPRDSGRQVRVMPMFFYSSKAPEDKTSVSSASATTRTNGSNPSAQAAALAATAYVPDLKVKLPPFQSPGLIVHPSLGFTASSSNTLSAANLHLEKKIASEMFSSGLEQSGYAHQKSSKESKSNKKVNINEMGKTKEKSKTNEKGETNDSEAGPAAKDVDMRHRGSSTTRTIEDLFDRWIPGDEARKLIPKDFYEPSPCMVEDEEHLGVTKQQHLTVIHAFQKALGSYVEDKHADEEEGSEDHNIMSGCDKNMESLPLHKRLPQLPQDFKDMLPVSLISPYAEDFTYTAKLANYTQEVACREQFIVQCQQAAKQRKKKKENTDASSGTANSAKETAIVKIPPVPRPPTPPSAIDASALAYQPAPQEHLLKHLDSHMYEPTTSRYHGLLSSAIADPQYVGPNAPGLLGLIHMMSAVGSSANAAAAAAAALGGADGIVAGKKRKTPAGKKKPGGGASKNGKPESPRGKTVKQDKATVAAKLEPEVVNAEEGAIPETTASVVGVPVSAKKKNMKIKIMASGKGVASGVLVTKSPVKKKKKKKSAVSTN